ncbi:hypothetical protein T03_12958, partial [Trichinella britovi]
MQGCIRNSGSFSACTQPAESSGTGVGRNKSRILAAGLPLMNSAFPFHLQRSYVLVVTNVSISQC